MSPEHAVPCVSLATAATLGDALRLAAACLAAEGIESAQLDAQVLLAHVTGLPRATLLAYPERPLDRGTASAYAALVGRRARHEPVAYLTGHREFMGLEFQTDPRALIPRPETELLAEAALAEIRARLAAGGVPVVADIGTGTGAIAIALAVLEPRLPYIYATDLSAEALALAGSNARRLVVHERLRLLRGDLLEPLPEPVDVLIANLPYVASGEAASLQRDVAQYEPPLALYSGTSGLDHLRRLFAQAPTHLRPGATLVLEFGYDQRAPVEALARVTFPGCDVRIGTDYAGWDRYAIVRT
jgi:release factor glutamine methyltransferase